MAFTCLGCNRNFAQDRALRGHLNNKYYRKCRATHDAILQRRIAAGEPSVDPDDPDQWQAPDLDDPEPRDDDLQSYDDPAPSGRLRALSELPEIDRSAKRTRSGTITRNTLVKSEIRRFPLAAKIIRTGERSPWELRVCACALSS